MNRILLALLVMMVFSCKNNPENKETGTPSETEMKQEPMAEHPWPAALHSVLEAHGGLEQWQKQRTLTFILPKPELPEIHITDLRTRLDKVETDKFSLGNDSEGVWVNDPEEMYKGNAGFYHNLMFYFYAMPFILTDPGIHYSAAENITFEGKEYPGIRIAYDDGVGASSKDEYYLHYDPETYQMAWLGYTVTYGKDEKSDTVKWIQYHTWQTVNDVVLPKEISWFVYEGLEMKEARNNLPFENVTLSETSNPKYFYQRPEGATSVSLK
ncbi:MAG: DUF6503 family protein [Bacteroidota bacterium]